MNIKLCVIGLAAFLVSNIGYATDNSKNHSEHNNRVKSLKVKSDAFFNATTIKASAGESFFITAKGIVDISNQNGGYLTTPDGTIAVTPPVNSGAFQFFLNNGGPTNTDPVKDSRKSFLLCCGLPGHLPGAPYGALVAGFSQTATPSSFADFPDGFALINTDGIAKAPITGGYLFLGVNDFNNPDGDNSGSFNVKIIRIKD
jgi:hypothetical protein